MVQGELRLLMRQQNEVVSELDLTGTQRYYADLNMLAVSIAKGRFPTSGEYLTAAARLYGLCTSLHEALQRAKDIESCQQIVRLSGLPIGIVEEINTAIVKTDERQNRNVQTLILNACLGYVDDFELGTVGLQVDAEPVVQSWGEILLKAATCPNLVIQTPTEIQLRDSLEAVSSFLSTVTTNVACSPKVIIDHTDLASHKSREANLRFLERISLDVYKPATLTMIHVYHPTKLRTQKVICQLFPRTGLMIHVMTDLKRRSAIIRFMREDQDTAVSRLRNNGFVDPPDETPRSIAQALDVEVEVRIHRDLRRSIAKIYLEATA